MKHRCSSPGLTLRYSLSRRNKDSVLHPNIYFSSFCVLEFLIYKQLWKMIFNNTYVFRTVFRYSENTEGKQKAP
jgi:hypothetical protein